MRKRQRLGQHFLESQTVAKKIVDAAELTKNDTVLEIGTGCGILVPYLCKKAAKVISVESDKYLYLQNKEKFSKISNLTLKNQDGFKIDEKFSVFVSNLPYSKSRDAIEWLIQKDFCRAVIMVQKEFAQKLQNKGKQKKALSVLASHAVSIEKIINVTKSNFRPQPKVDSVVLRITPKKKLSKKLIHTVNKLFSYKRKSLSNVLKQFGKSVTSKKRLEELDGNEIIKIAKQLIRN